MTRLMPRPLPLALALALAFGATAVHAQADARAVLATPVQIGIAAQPLAQALNDWARQTRLQIVVQQELVAGKTAPAVAGRLTPRQALDRLLAGSGLAAAEEGSAVVLRRLPAPSNESVLPAVPVTARAERVAATEGTGSYTTGVTATATPLGLSIRETPQAVSVITRQRIEDQGLTQLADVVAQTPGLVMSAGGNVGSDSSPIYARGFAVETYMVDGVRQTDSGYSSIFQSQDMTMFDRVEVVRGATGLMNGLGTPGAAINLVRKRPTAQFQAMAKVELGSWKHRRIEADVSAPLNDAGSVRGRVAASAQSSDAYIDRLTDDRKVLFGTVEADLGPSTLLRGGLSVQHLDSDANARGGLPAYYSDGTLVDWGVSDSAAPAWSYSRRHGTSVFAALEHRLANDWQLKATLTRTTTDYDELVGYASGGNPDRATGAGVSIWASHWKGEPRQDSLDLSATGRFGLLGREHDLALGVQFSRSFHLDPAYTNWYHTGWSGAVPNIFNWDGLVPAAPNNPAVGTYSSDERLNSAYATARFRLTDPLSVLVGARVTDWSRYQTSTTFATGTTTITDRGETGQVTPYLGVVYDFGEHWSAYGSYTSIFKPQNNKTVNGDYLDPVLGSGAELGVKGAFLDDRLNVSAAVFDIEQDNFAVAIPNTFAPDGSQAYDSMSGTTSRGIELEAAGELRPGWQVAASFTRTMVKDRTGKAINTNVPRNTVKLFSSYRLGSGAARGLVVGGGLRWQNEIYADNQGPAAVRFTQPSYAVVDLMARYPITSTLTLSGNVYNAFDERYRTNTGNSYFGAPRHVRVSLEARF